MPSFLKSTKGFTFIEAIITFSIVGIFLALTWATVQFLVSKSTEQIIRTRAHFLAVEGVELVKQIRQTAVNKNRRNGFFRSIGNKNGDYILVKSGDEYDLQNGADEKIEITDDPYMIYCRRVSISGLNSGEKKAKVRVSWGDLAHCNQNDHQLSYEIYLADTVQ